MLSISQFYCMVIKIISLNVHGIRSSVKRRVIFNYVKQQADIAVLLETHSSPQDKKGWTLENGADIIFSHGETNARGTCILFRNNFQHQLKNVHRCKQGRYV